MVLLRNDGGDSDEGEEVEELHADGGGGTQEGALFEDDEVPEEHEQDIWEEVEVPSIEVVLHKEAFRVVLPSE